MRPEHWLYTIPLRLRSLFRWAQADQELDDELRNHLERKTEEYVAQGMTQEEAHRRARLDLGGIEQTKEKCRDARHVNWIQDLIQDLRFGLRVLRMNPWFTAVAVLTLALGIGANTAMFSVMNAVLFRPLPYRSPTQLVMLWTEEPNQNSREERSAYWNIEQWRHQSKSFADMAFWDPVSVTLITTMGAEHLSAARISPNFFGLLGVQPLVGRTFSMEEAEQHQRLALISRRFWESHFGESPEVIGASIELDGIPYRIIGVIPAKFQFAITGGDVWLPHTTFPDWEVLGRARGAGSWFVIGRLRPDVTFKQAQAEMITIAQRLHGQLPTSEKDLGVNVVPLSLQITGPRLRQALWMLTGAVFFVLLIATTNIASLLLARATSRNREIAIRAALGASHWRIARQMLAESLTLGVVSGLPALVVAWAGIQLILLLKPGDMARLNEVNLDPRALVCTLALCLLTGILVGLTPAITLARSRRGPSAQERGPGVSVGTGMGGIRHVLIVTEFALGIILLAGAGLLIRSLRSVESVDPGLASEHVLSVQLSTPASMGDAQLINFYNRTLDRVESLPTVKGAGIIGDIFINSVQEQTLTAEGAAVSTRFQLRNDEVSEGFFTALGIPLLRGRFLSAADGPDAPKVAIINSVMARRLWPGLDPVGRRFKFGPADSKAAWFTVVGVVGDMHRQGLEKEPVAQMFSPLKQNPSRLETLLVRTSSDEPLKMVGALRAAVHQIDKQAVVYDAATLKSRLGAFLGQRRFHTSLLLGFSAIALLLAAVGIFGLIQYTVATRAHEIGIRMALGAEKGDVLRMVVGQGLKLALFGVGIGIAGALWLTRFLSSQLYGVTPTDPMTFTLVSVLLTAVALVACYIPARRAAKVDPMVALRYE